MNKLFFSIAVAVFATAAMAEVCFHTGNFKQYQSKDGSFKVACEYQSMSGTFWRYFNDYSCPSSVNKRD